ncbi:hypothetical protein ACFYV7_17435 [Nocardia suismassiliense]|uniref:Uncharacterized protein n=1 Tax=Nocardia suismassiliense TaxID=2077092 RepID=A0ABW6QTL9_9NOCA
MSSRMVTRSTPKKLRTIFAILGVFATVSSIAMVASPISQAQEQCQAKSRSDTWEYYRVAEIGGARTDNFRQGAKMGPKKCLNYEKGDYISHFYGSILFDDGRMTFMQSNFIDGYVEYFYRLSGQEDVEWEKQIWFKGGEIDWVKK